MRRYDQAFLEFGGCPIGFNLKRGNTPSNRGTAPASLALWQRGNGRVGGHRELRLPRFDLEDGWPRYLGMGIGVFKSITAFAKLIIASIVRREMEKKHRVSNFLIFSVAIVTLIRNN
jgi:hypothetical protein